jgi:small subunit ribosomal protein S4
MKVGPKFKIARRLGASVFEKTQTQKFALSQERKSMVKSKGRGRGPTEFGKQLIEKQKVRLTYGITERQFSRYVREAMESHDKSITPSEHLHRTLETRLDNVVYRLGLASTRRGARQMVSHGHVTVNGRKTSIPSRAVKQSDKIGVREGSRSSVLFENFGERFAERQLPSWLAFDAKSMQGGLENLPTMVSSEPAGDLGVVFSFYSR